MKAKNYPRGQYGTAAGIPTRIWVFVGTFVILRKLLLASTWLSVRMEQLRSHWTSFDEI